MTKKEIVFDYLSKDNSEKSIRTAVQEILNLYGVNVSVMMVQKTKKEWSVQSVQQPESVQSVQQPESVQSVQQPESVQSVQPVNRLDWLESLMNGVKKATNVFEMVEAIRQCDVYVQKTGESIKEDLECVYDELLQWQKLLIDKYGLHKRHCFTF